jgi:hypothetical protein
MRRQVPQAPKYGFLGHEFFEILDRFGILITELGGPEVLKRVEEVTGSGIPWGSPKVILDRKLRRKR